MVFEWCKSALSVFFLTTGTLIIGMAIFGVNRFDRALDRTYAVAMGDTLGISSVVVGLVVIRGSSMDNLKLLPLTLFFWVTGSVSGHMISHLEMTTNKSLANLPVIDTDE